MAKPTAAPAPKSPLATTLAVRLDSTPRTLTPLSGGDINRVYLAALEDGRQMFIKTNPRPHPGMYRAEAEGLRFLAESGSPLIIPQAVAHSDGEDGEVPFLALPLLEARGSDRAAEQALGRGLAELHRCRAPHFGLAEGNYIAILPQDNTPGPEWPTFYVERRLAPMIERARDMGRLNDQQAARFERLYDRLPDLLASPEPPARLHGDLWGGNAMMTEAGPAIFDPAVYGGHREVDLAMMHLFGGFSRHCFAAYDECYPLAPGHAERRPLYQLYPLLVHVVLFGGHYAADADRILQRFV